MQLNCNSNCVQYLEDLKLANGVYRELKFLITTKEDFEDFIGNFWTNSNNQVIALNDFRQHRLHKRNIQLDKFLYLYRNNPINALEELFLEKVFQSDIEELESQIARDKITLEKLYYSHKEKPGHRMRYFLLRN